MSETENGRLGLYGTEHSKCNHLMTLGFKGLTLLVGDCAIACPVKAGFRRITIQKKYLVLTTSGQELKSVKYVGSSTHIYMNSTTTIIFKPALTEYMSYAVVTCEMKLF